MSKREAISRYNLIINKLRKHPCTFHEILDYLEFESDLQGYNFVVSKRTFQRDVEEIRSIFNIDIQFDFSKKVYFIDYEEQPEVSMRILEAYDTFNALNITDRISSYIHFEQRNPKGTENLYGLLHAIKNRLQITFSYQKFSDDKPSDRIAEPYALKEFRYRWYVVAKDLKDAHVKIFALDRLTNFHLTKSSFKHPVQFDVKAYFRNCFGVTAPNTGKPLEVILSYSSFQGKFIKSLPLHETQEVLIDDVHEYRIRLTVFLTHEFIMEILAMGENVTVLEPKELIDQLTQIGRNVLNKYQLNKQS